MKDWKPVIQYRSPESLTPYARNAKHHPVEQLDRIAAQISAVGFTQPIVVDKDFVVIAGHGRRDAAIRLGLKEVPVVVADHLNEYEVMAARIADNKVSEGGVWDLPQLAFDIGTLEREELDLGITGMSMEAVRETLAVLSSQAKEPEKEPEKKETPPEEDAPKPEKKCPQCGFSLQSDL